MADGKFDFFDLCTMSVFLVSVAVFVARIAVS